MFSDEELLDISKIQQFSLISPQMFFSSSKLRKALFELQDPLKLLYRI